MSDFEPRKIVIYGAGGHGKVVGDIVQRQGDILAGFIDDDRSGEVLGYPILGGEDALAGLRGRDIQYAISAVGDAELREEIDQRLLDAGFSLAMAIHPSAQIAGGATIGDGSVIMPGGIIGPDAVLGRSCIVNTNAAVDHDCELAEYVQIAPGATLGGVVKVGHHTMVGIGAVVNMGVRIGANVIVASGAAVYADVPDRARVGRMISLPGR